METKFRNKKQKTYKKNYCLDKILLEGSREILQAAIEADVAAFIEKYSNALITMNE